VARRAPLFLALTRPPMVWGIPVPYFAVWFGISGFCYMLSMHLAMYDAPAKRDSYLFENLPYVTCITDNIVLTRDTELLGCVLLHGISADTTSEEDLDALSATFANLINSTQGRVTYYVSKITSRRSFDYAPMSGDGFADLVDRRWKDSFKGAQPFERKYLITIGIRPNRQDGFKAIFSKKRSAFFATNLNSR